MTHSLSRNEGIFFLAKRQLGFTSAFLWNLLLLMGACSRSMAPNFVRALHKRSCPVLRKQSGVLKNE